jgi:4-methylaminobutanoate oxidase (formaldehyde-forming)
MEKGYRHWGHDITDEDTPLEAGLGFAVAWSKPDFIGRDALLRQKEEGPRRVLVQIALGDPEKLLYHNEPIWRDGILVGRVTSGMFGHTVGKSLGMGYIESTNGRADAEFVRSGRYEVEVAGDRIAAEVATRPFYDPTGWRVKGLEEAVPRLAAAS